RARDRDAFAVLEQRRPVLDRRAVAGDHRFAEPRLDLVLPLERRPRVRPRTLGADPRLAERVRAEDGARRVPLGHEIGILGDPSAPPGLAPGSCRCVGVHDAILEDPPLGNRGSIGTTSTPPGSAAALTSAEPRGW